MVFYFNFLGEKQILFAPSLLAGIGAIDSVFALVCKFPVLSLHRHFLISLLLLLRNITKDFQKFLQSLYIVFFISGTSLISNCHKLSPLMYILLYVFILKLHVFFSLLLEKITHPGTMHLQQPFFCNFLSSRILMNPCFQS